MAMFPLSDAVWGCFFRGIVFGFLAGFVVILLFLSFTGKYGMLARVRPIGLVYFLAGVEIGIALIGGIALFGLNALHNWGQRMLDQSKHGGT